MRTLISRLTAGALAATLFIASAPALASQFPWFPGNQQYDPVIAYGGPVMLWSRTFAYVPFWTYNPGTSFALTCDLYRLAAVPALANPAPAQAAVRKAAPKPAAGGGWVASVKKALAPKAEEVKAPIVVVPEQEAPETEVGVKLTPDPAPAPAPTQPEPTPTEPAPAQPEPAPAQPEPAKPAPAPAPQPAPVKPAPVQPAPQPAPAPAQGLTAAEQQMLNLVNAERARAGLRPLQADLKLTQVARLKSQDMIVNNYFSHQSPTYGSPFDMMKRYGISYRAAAENIAGNQSVERAHTALMNSSGHRANILSSNYTHIGIGIVEGGRYGMMFTQMFIGR